jgi:ABC-type bacteriocin/lantibiotic exporter with double-glycine peptidase domain
MHNVGSLTSNISISRTPLHARLDWENVGYHVEARNLFKMSATRKDILAKISGSIDTGQIVALMGHSGSGKVR